MTENDLMVYKELRKRGYRADIAWDLTCNGDGGNELREDDNQLELNNCRHRGMIAGLNVEAEWTKAMCGLNDDMIKRDGDGNPVHRVIIRDDAFRDDGTKWRKVIFIIESSDVRVIADHLRYGGYPVIGQRMADGTNWFSYERQ